MDYQKARQILDDLRSYSMNKDSNMISEILKENDGQQACAVLRKSIKGLSKYNTDDLIKLKVAGFKIISSVVDVVHLLDSYAHRIGELEDAIKNNGDVIQVMNEDHDASKMWCRFLCVYSEIHKYEEKLKERQTEQRKIDVLEEVIYNQIKRDH